MSDVLLSWVSLYGAPALFLVTALGCFGVPLPSSLALLVAGALVAGGDLDTTSTLVAALAGAVLGDQAGYGLGRLGGPRLLARRSSEALRRAEAFFRLRGDVGIFLSRWLVSPLGPPLNLIAGVFGMGWRRFTATAVLGEAVWVAGYVAIGWAFRGSLLALADFLDDLGWFLAGLAASLVIALLLGRLLRRRLSRRDARGNRDAA